MSEITVIGGGLAGLIAAVECAERGASVRLLEARGRLGGRASSTPGPFAANLGPHALYRGGVLWDWLRRRRLHQPARVPRSPAIRFRWRGELRATPPAAALRAWRSLGAEAPVEQSFRDWVADRHGEETASALANLAGVLTFDPDPGRLSAAFVWERMRRILLAVPPPARYVVGGWGTLVGRVTDHARVLGVTIETGARVGRVEDLSGPVVVAVEPRAARALLADPGLAPESPRVALLDVGLVRRRRDPYLVVDLDEPTFTDRFTAIDRSLAPDGHDLLQASVGLAEGEDLDDGVARLAAVLDLGYPGWRTREVWRRRGSVQESTGALDLPGRTWRDRTPVAYADGVWLAGDWVAAPGHLAEVSCASAVQAAELATAQLPKTQRVALVANSSSRSMTAKARSGTNSRTRLAAMKSASSPGATGAYLAR